MRKFQLLTQTVSTLVAVGAITTTLAAPLPPPKGAIKVPDCKPDAGFCAKKDLLTGYDFCDTDYLENYQALSACKKQVYLDWNIAHNGAYGSSLPPVGGPGAWDLSSLRDAVYLAVTFDTNSDFMPQGRKKIFHTSGVAGKFRFVAESTTPYTGVFRGAAGIARLSLAKSDWKKNFTPGIALKFLVDGEQSVNIMAMYSLDGQGANRDFFANRFSSWIEDPKDFMLSHLIMPAFTKVLNPPTRLPLDHLADTDALGRKEVQPKAPFSIYLVPEAGLSKPEASSSLEDFRRILARLKPGTKLYSVYAIDAKPANPAAPKTDGGTLIGTIVLDGPLTASHWEDERLFFQHGRN